MIQFTSAPSLASAAHTRMHTYAHAPVAPPLPCSQAHTCKPSALIYDPLYPTPPWPRDMLTPPPCTPAHAALMHLAHPPLSPPLHVDRPANHLHMPMHTPLPSSLCAPLKALHVPTTPAHPLSPLALICAHRPPFRCMHMCTPPPLAHAQPSNAFACQCVHLRPLLKCGHTPLAHSRGAPLHSLAQV